MTATPADPNTELLRLRQEALVLQAKVACLQDENKKLLARISELVSPMARVADRNRDRFGKRSERLGNPDGPPKRADTHKPHTRPKRTGSKRTPQPDLPVVPVVHELPEALRCCPKCDGRLHARAGRGSVNTRIAVTARKYTLVEHRLQEYGCGSCGHTEQADPPAQLVPGGRYDGSIAVQVAVDKYQDHQPIERQVEQMRRQGVHITSQALWNQLWALFLVLVPSYEALHAELLTEALLYADETRWRLMNAGGSTTWWMWTLGGLRGVLFLASPTRGNAAARLLLRDFSGVVMADGYGVYKSLALEAAALRAETAAQPALDLDVTKPEGVNATVWRVNLTLASCWMHARRPFFKAHKHNDDALVALDLIAKLYAVEDQAEREAGGDDAALLEARRRLRNDVSRGLVAELYAWRDRTLALPKSQLFEGLTYLLNQREGLLKFLDDPRIPLDNGFAERAVRAVVLGRKNHLGSRSERGARAAALFYSLLGSCKLAGVNPELYLMTVVERALVTKDYALTPQQLADELAAIEAKSA